MQTIQSDKPPMQPDFLDSPFMRHHKGKLLGVICGLFVGVWGVLIGFCAGLAFDLWQDFLEQQLSDKWGEEIASRVSLDATAVLAMITMARSLALPGLRRPSHVLAIMKRHFLLDAETLRYVGKVIYHHEKTYDDEISMGTALRHIQAETMPRRMAILGALLELTRDGSPLVDVLALKALADIALQCGIDKSVFEVLVSKAGLQPDAKLDDPYAVLRVAHGSSLADVQAAYRRLMQENHPDLAQGAGNPVLLARAQERAARINAAYTRIRKSRAS